MKNLSIALSALALCAWAAGASTPAIPDRPEKLKFPPLDYEPPDPKAFRVELKNGPVAYVASDKELPLVNIAIYIRGGDYVETEGSEGLAELTGYLLSRGGAGTNTAEQLEERLAFLAANLSSSFGDTQGSVSLNLLSKDIDEGLRILRAVLTEPRFQESRFALRKNQLLQAMRQRNDDSSDIEGREREFLAYGEKFWANRYTTEAS
ncbi:MAG: insulinase family protein, partial [Gammaproteobacteria bacterium]